MPTRSLLVLAALLSIANGCEDPEKEKALQRKAEERISKIQGEAAEKVAAAEKKIAELQDQLVEAGAQAKAQADEEVSKVKTEADKLAADATDALRKARTAYKESERREFGTLMKDLDELRAKAQGAQPKVKTQLDQALKGIATKKDAARKDIDAFDTATLESLRAVKVKADQALAQLKQAIHSARAKVP